MIIDLHNRTRFSVKKILEKILKKKNEKIHLIVGRGIHSYNKKPIIKNYVINYLKSKNISYTICQESKGGVIII